MRPRQWWLERTRAVASVIVVLSWPVSAMATPPRKCAVATISDLASAVRAYGRAADDAQRAMVQARLSHLWNALKICPESAGLVVRVPEGFPVSGSVTASGPSVPAGVTVSQLRAPAFLRPALDSGPTGTPELPTVLETGDASDTTTSPDLRMPDIFRRRP